jgi:hypothetical protein
MSSITTRAAKGSALTHAEVDANFTNLNSGKAEVSGQTFTGPVVLPAGSATAGGVQVGTGATYKPSIYSPGADQLAISTGGTGRLFVDASGNAGIGTADAKSRLHIESTSGTITSATISQQVTYGGGTSINARAQINLCLRETSFTADQRIFGRVEAGTESDGGSGSGFLAFATRTGGTISEKARLDSSGRLGIGTSAPLRNLSVVGTGYTGNINVSDTSGGTAYGMLSLGAHGFAASDVGMWRGSPNQILGGNSLNLGCRDNIVFAVSSADLGSQTERMRLDSSGRLLVGLTSANTSGAKLQTSDGLTFPATQVASSDPNTLDDYEEGTWTPTDVSGAGLTFSTATGKYTKIGRYVVAQFLIIYPATSSTAVAAIGGLPFTQTTLGGGNSTYTSSSVNGIMLRTLDNSSTMYMTLASSQAATMTNAQLSASTSTFTYSYMV